MTIYGRVLDTESREPVPGATVALYNGQTKVAATVATAAGEFTLTTSNAYDIQGMKLVITSVGYLNGSFELSDKQNVYLLLRDIKELPPVVIYPKKKTSYWVWLMLGAGVLLTKKTKG